MHELLAALAGVALGAFFYGGLWWTVRRIATFRRPALCMLASLVLRGAGVLLGLLVVAGADWRRMLLCLAGFMLARGGVARLVRRAGTAPAAPATGLRHAP